MSRRACNLKLDCDKLDAIEKIIGDPTDYLSLPIVYKLNIPMTPLEESTLTTQALARYIELLHKQFMKIIDILDGNVQSPSLTETE